VALTTRQRVKDRAGKIPTEHDALVDRLITALEAFLDGLAGRKVGYADQVEYFDGDWSDELSLPRRPVHGVTTVHVSTDAPRAYGAAELLVADQDYILDGDTGLLHRIGAVWPRGPKTVRVQYAAGWADPGAGSTEVPGDVEEAVVESILAKLFTGKDGGGGYVLSEQTIGEVTHRFRSQDIPEGAMRVFRRRLGLPLF
jgi:hypothetical protein